MGTAVFRFGFFVPFVVVESFVARVGEGNPVFAVLTVLLSGLDTPLIRLYLVPCWWVPGEKMETFGNIW